MTKDAFSYFASRPRLAFLLTGFVALAGVLGLFSLKRESIPPVDFGSVIIRTAYPGASPEEVESLVTLKIEDELRGIDGVEEVKSVSRPGISEITVKLSLDDGDPDDTADEIQRAVLRVNGLPAELPAPPRLTRMKSGQIPVFDVALTGGQAAARDEAAELLEDHFEDVDGVAEARLFGYRPRELTVLLDSAKMAARQVSLGEVTSGLSRHLRDIPGGYLKRNGSEILVRALGKVREPADLEDFIIRGRVGAGAVRIRDIGAVRDGRAEASTLARFGGEPAVLVSVTKRNRADTIRTVAAVRKELARITPELPAGVAAVPYDDEAGRVSERLKVVSDNAWSGLLLILAVLLFLLPGAIGVMAAVSLPVSLLALAAFMAAAGLSFNVITMIAIVIVLGLFIDNSAVVTEAYSRLRLSGRPPEEAAAGAARLFFVPILATVLANAAGFAPLLVTTGVMGQFVFSIPVVVTGALFFSLFETFFLLPARLRYTLRSPRQGALLEDETEAGWFGVLQRGFRRLVAALVARRYLAFAGLTIVVAGSVYAAVFLNRFDLFPKERTQLYIARFETAPGSSLAATDAAGAELSRLAAGLLAREGVPVESLAAQIGSSQADGDDAQGKVGNNAGLLRLAVPQAAAEKIETGWLLSKLRELKLPILRRLDFEAAAAGPPVGPPLNVICRGHDDGPLNAFVAEFKAGLASLPYVRNLSDDADRGPEEYQLELDKDLLRRAGFTMEDVGRALQTALQGVEVSNINVRSREVEVRVRLRDADREVRGDLERISLMTPQDTLMPLGNVAKIRRAEGPVTRKRFNFQRAVTVSADLEQGASSALEVNARAREIVSGLKKKYPGVQTRMGGEEENTRESLRSLFNAMALSLMIILLILVVINDSFKTALPVLSTIPLGLAGVSYVFWLAGKPLSFMALIGVIGLGGVIVNAAIVLVSFLEDARRARPDRPLPELIAEVTALRFKAVLVTNITTIAGLLPTAYGLGGKDPLLVPLSLAMGWGLLAGSALSLVWLPCGYMILHDLRSEGIRALWARLRGRPAA